MTSRVRVRYAPSPTGDPHVGNIRTAIFNWLFARNQNGTFIVRIEDTDVKRRVDGATQVILDSLHWLGLDWDEGPHVGGDYGPYIQSQRLSYYQEAAQRLLDQNDAYYCYCSPERLAQIRQKCIQIGETPRYDRRCRNISVAERRQQDGTPVIRFKMPLDGEIPFPDLIRGDVTIDLKLLDDFVIMKSDYYPTYHLASVVDDHLMEISHVLRAEEWLSSAPRHQQLYRTLGYPMPLFAHLPIILGHDRSKLSKRHGATSVLAYQRMGYLPDAMLNFLALLGWSLDDHTEFIPCDKLIRHFSLERIGASPAIFNEEKLTWLNGVYIRQLSTEKLAEVLTPVIETSLPHTSPRPLDWSYLMRIVPLVQERLKTLSEAPNLTSFFFTDSVEYNPATLIQRKADRAACMHALQATQQSLQSVESWGTDNLESLLRRLAEVVGLSTSQLFGCIRVAVTGRTAAPPLFQTMEVLGRDRCLTRIESAWEKLHALPSQP